MTFAELFGHRLLGARLERGWTLRDLAAKSGVSFQMISAYENGTHVPGLRKAVTLAAALEVSLDALTAPEGVPS